MVSAAAVVFWGVLLSAGADSSARKIDEIRRGELLITQYGNYEAQQQYLFYTIQNRKGELMVIDGGWDYLAEEVRDVIRSKGGKVDYWVLTHPHPDHMGAFNEIYKNPEDIEIGQVYTVNIDYDKYQQAAQSYDGLATYENFLTQTKGDSRIHYINSPDEKEWMGMKVKIFSAYSEKTLATGGNIPNEGSLVFQIAGKTEKMLFCSDIGLTGDVVLSEFGNEIKSDYLQMGHHGNGGCSWEFYEKVDPRTAFFDAPKWLVDGESYNTREGIQFMEKLGANTYTMEGTPHQFILK